MNTLGSLCSRLALDVVEVIHLAPDAEHAEVLGLLMPEAQGEPEPADGRIVLALRVESPEQALRLLGSWDAGGTAENGEGHCAVVLPATAVDPAVREAARAGRTTVLTPRAGVSWLRLIAALHDEVGPDASEPPDEPVEVRFRDAEGDLFDVADSVARQIGAPVTIEDPRSRVIAFSTHLGSVDTARTESIMRREVPPQYLDRMRDHGVFRRMLAADGPIFVSGRGPDIQARAAMAIRAGREHLGSIWVVVDEPLPREHARILKQAAAVVAVQLLRRRQSSDYERRIHTDTVRRLLSGDADGISGVSWLLDSAREHLVIATNLAGDAGRRKDADWERNAIADALRTHLMATAPESLTAIVDNTVYAVVSPSSPAPQRDRALRRFLTDFVGGFTADGRHHPIQVGIGTSVRGTRDLPASRRLADIVLRVLAARGDESVVATIDEIGAEALIFQGRETIARTPALGGAASRRIRDYDQQHQTQLAETLHAWLRAHGSSDGAALILHVHPNTVRYRIRQLRELGLIDLDDPAERFAAYLHLGA